MYVGVGVVSQVGIKCVITKRNKQLGKLNRKCRFIPYTFGLCKVEDHSSYSQGRTTVDYNTLGHNRC